ncbi:GntR family transcriptional regulator [uncultured Aeromicrobium sp.]|uniref:GntR family transcriptional regulator n=1 Tax=uncultured Aeromicrobium sp. TaxID=337820 RepID=UPI0025D6778F|nr:GntR family transcriptional regulator [uncultured Aeromicrobium sp.]
MAGHVEVSGLEQARRAAVDWHRCGRVRPLRWVERTAGLSPFPASTTDHVVTALRSAIVSGQLGAGAWIAEHAVSSQLGISRSRVREGLRRLADDAVVELHPDRLGARIREPTAQDVDETYALRRVLGTLLWQRVASGPRDRLRALDRAWEQLLTEASSGHIQLTADADLAWQDTMARVSDSRRIGAPWLRSSHQLRIFIALLGPRYSYDIEGIVSYNARLMSAVHQSQPGRAVTVWDSKVRAAKGYLLERTS